MSTIPDLSSKPFQHSVQRDMTADIEVLHDAWTRKFDTWFAAPGTMLMKPEVDVPIDRRMADLTDQDMKCLFAH